MKKKLERKLLLSAITVCMAGILTGCHEHNYSQATCVSPAICTECGETTGEPLGHDYKPATCTDPEKCIRCGDTIGSALGHTWIEATCVEPQTCSVCGETEGEALGHDYTDAKCEEDSICNRCGDVIEALGHQWIEATCKTPKTCERCGATDGEALGHSLDENSICTRCGVDKGSLEEIKKVCGLLAGCQKNVSACVVHIEKDHNPYDVEYDYGDEYNAYIDMCDWSLVFDADYYIKTFPMLAKLYHNDKDLLLEHFQTVGVHEGRQGNADFNLSAYYFNCEDAVYNAFEKKYEGYYLYYMLNYDKEKDIDTINPPEGKAAKKQRTIVYTALQAGEYKDINKYRADVDAQDVKYDSELSALANYRAYINSKDNWDAHDWAIQRESDMRSLIIVISPGQYKYAENNVTGGKGSDFLYGKLNSRSYFDSTEHYEAMVNTKYNYCGVSNWYIGKNNKTNTYKKSESYQTSQFDLYLNELHTALHP